MNTSEQITDLAAALCAAQEEIGNAEKDRKNPHFGSEYATLAAVRDASRPMHKHGLSVVQTARTHGNVVTVETMLLHKSGQWVSDALELTARDASPQSIGSAITYGRRYTLAAFCGIAPADDDGNAAQGHDDRQQESKSAPTVNYAIGEPSAKGYYRVSDYRKDGAFHTAHVIGADAQGGAIKVATKLTAVGKELQRLADGETECVVDMTMKGRGEAWLNSIKSRMVAEGTPQLPPPTVEISASDIPF